MTLTEYRENLGWSRAELAREAKLDYQTVTKAENGEQITGRSARAIADALSKALGTNVKFQDIDGLSVRA
jgi:transcriptional regulator with XRE-family HTH domain